MNKLLNLIGLATNGGNAVAGAFLTERAVKSGEARLVIVAEDASDRSAHDFASMCEYYETPCIRFGTQETLGRYAGKERRTAVAITDEGLARAIWKRFDGLTGAAEKRM